MDNLWRTIRWKQFGAAIDMLDDALTACPDALWRQPVWPDASVPSRRTEFWYVTYHTLFWLDLYLFGSEEGFTPPAPFALTEQDDADGPLPDQTYSKDELRAYLASVRQKCRTTLETMTDEQARHLVNFGWMREGEVVTYAELQLYSMRHVQGHAAELSLLLGQNGVTVDYDWVTRAKDDPAACSADAAVESTRCPVPKACRRTFAGTHCSESAQADFAAARHPGAVSTASRRSLVTISAYSHTAWQPSSRPRPATASPSQRFASLGLSTHTNDCGAYTGCGISESSAAKSYAALSVCSSPGA